MYNNKPPKLTKKKMIELIIIVAAILWVLLFALNYFRYTKSKPLILSIHLHEEYKDGYVDEYISLGYTYRKYSRLSISREELVPFWVFRENPAVINDLPQVEKDYHVPDNYRHEDKYMGLLYYYSTENSDLLGTFKCINSSSDCEKATTGWDKFNILDADPLTRRGTYKFATMYNKYAWVDDSSRQSVKYGETGYVRTIYLYQFSKKDPKVLARYADIKETSYNDIKELANYDDYTYIVREYNTDKWGIIRVNESGSVTQLLPFEYESVNYDYDTGLYIVCKDGSWFAYDLKQEKKMSVESVDIIYDVWKNVNNSYYFKTGHKRTIGSEQFMEYSIYRFDGAEFLKGDHITEIMPKKNYIMYLTASDSKLHFIVYSKKEKYTVQLNFSQMEHDQYTHPAFDIYYDNDYSLSLKIYDGRELKYGYEVITVFTQNWDFNDD